MRSKFIDKTIDYTGEQLRSHYIYETFGMEGDAIIGFIGVCRVKEHMVDLSDKLKKEFISSDRMLHFIIEHFDGDLEKAVLRKRLMVSIIGEHISRVRVNDHSPLPASLCRRDNGLYIGDKKLSVAVATASPVSTLIHIGLNISSKNTPVKTIGLKDLGIEPKKLALDAIELYRREIDSIRESRCKVAGVK